MKSKLLIQPIQEVYKPTFDIREDLVLDIGSKKIGEKIKLLVDFEVVEKTKSYVIIRANNLIFVRTKRTF